MKNEERRAVFNSALRTLHSALPLAGMALATPALAPN
jgi:hypothetical protein